jgi:crossover junction endodeoxyribonuclease RuvC
MLILGIDPGYDRLGWGVVDKAGGKYAFVSCGIIQTHKTNSHSARLHQIYEELSEVIEEHKPNACVVEDLFFSNNAKSAIKVAQARGVILLTCQKAGLEINELTPPQIKLAVTGNGRADKKAVEKMVRLQLPKLPTKLIDDTLDALAAALSK